MDFAGYQDFPVEAVMPLQIVSIREYVLTLLSFALNYESKLASGDQIGSEASFELYTSCNCSSCVGSLPDHCSLSQCTNFQTA